MYAPARIKGEIRVLGVDDCSFDKWKDKKTKVIGVMFRGGKFLDGVMSCEVGVDGGDATLKIARMINRPRFRKQIQCILLDGIAVAGFNVIDIVKLSELTGLCVIVVMRKYPEIGKIHSALEKLGMKQKISLLKKAGVIHKIDGVFGGAIYIQFCGVSLEKAKRIINVCATHSFIPEPIRVAHLIGQGLILGESKGKA